MNKLDMKTPDLTDKNIEKIAELFPQVVTEKEGVDGESTRSVDFDLLRQLLSDSLVEGNDERYRLDWPGKRRSLLKANTPISKTLRPVREESVNFDTTQNLFIEGDNFEALKILQESYFGKVKMIYIDPPYNTGRDFVYSDKHTMGDEEYTELTGAEDEEGNRMFRENTRTNPRFHSDWLSMMYERLIIARDLLSDDGVIFISIDDNEVHNLRKVCDDVMGDGNFVAEIIRNTNSAKNQSLFVSVSHENCLIYARDVASLEKKHAENKWSVKKNNVDAYKAKVRELQNAGLSTDEISEELKLLTKYPRFIDFVNYWYFDERGLYQKADMGGVKNGNNTTILNPLTGKNDPIPPGGFRYKTEELERLKNDGRIHFHTDGSLPRLKRYLDENSTQRPRSIMSDDQRPDASLMTELSTPFDNPKQLTFMSRLTSISDKDAIVLDFFSGSATTAHAVMQQNAEDSGNRKFIMVQLPEETPSDSEASKAGYKNIAELGRERIRRAAKKIETDFADKLAERGMPLDTGFRTYRVDDTNMKDVFYHPTEITQDSLGGFVDNVKDDRTAEDLLTQVILQLGLTLDLPIEVKTLSGNTVYCVGGNALLACLDSQLTDGAIDEIAKLEPLKLVLRDSTFGTGPDRDQNRINLENRLKRLSPDTSVSVL